MENFELSFFFFLMIRRPPRSTLFPLHDALPISFASCGVEGCTTLSPGTCANHASRLWLCCAAAPVPDPPGRRTTSGTLALPPNMNRILRSEEHTSELQSRRDLVCRLLLEKKKQK